MKEISTFILILFTTIIFSQDLEKIKGSKNPILSEIVLDPVKSLELYDNIDILLIQSDEDKLVIYADDNLHEIVSVDLNEGKLSISLLSRIVKKKEFELTLYLTNLEKVVLNGNSKLSNNSFFKSEELNLTLNDKSDTNIFFEANSIVVNGNNSGITSSEVSFKAKSIDYNLGGRSKLKGSSTTETVKLILQDKSSINLTGKSDVAFVTVSQTAKAKLTDMVATTTRVIAEDRASVYTNTTEDLTISAAGNAHVFIYGNSKIDLKSFNGRAVLTKRD